MPEPKENKKTTQSKPDGSGRCQHIVHPLPPLYNAESEILILGSFPSVKTRETGFFYGHPQNRFWKLLARLFDEAIPGDIPGRKAFLLKHRIALWDVIYECDIVGSSDSSIRNAVPTDLAAILRESRITRVFCNGSRSYQTYRKYQEKALGREAELLPSTSPANAASSLDDLAAAWETILQR